MQSEVPLRYDEVMEGLVIRVTAYHGEPKLLGNIPYRAGSSHDTPVLRDDIVNDLEDMRTDYTVDDLIEEFQDEYGCKVNYEDGGNAEDGVVVYEFDIFEPSWPEKVEAENVRDDLAKRLVEWIQGQPLRQ